MIQPNETSEKFWRANPLVPAAALFLLGAALATQQDWPAKWLIFTAGTAWLTWLAGECLHQKWIAHAGLATLLLAGGAATYTLNQHYAEPQQIARFAAEREQMIALRARVDVPPDNPATHGNQYWLAHASEIWTDHGWLPTQGDLLVQWAAEGTPNLRRGTEVELYGWLSLPEPAKNPGAINPRRMLAADRIFAQIRVPRATGVVIRDDTSAAAPSWLTRMRLYLRGKLLEHTIQQDVPAALTLSALLLGHRDRSIADVSQSFADAGIAHLLAISGTHIVFFTALVWLALRYLPLRPRRREILIAAVVLLYVLATPCGPPILRAAVALLMVLLARLLGRPREYLNMLSAAAVIIILLRPSDIADAGFQLTFITTAGLILFSTRIHATLFEQLLAREALAAELGRTLWARWRYRLLRIGAALLVGNAIGALTAIPLVAFHFGQVNLWAIVSGIIAIPFVSAAMVVAIAQLLASLAGLGAWFAPLAALCGRAMIWIVAQLAALPGSAVSLRPPPPWAVLMMYALLALWAMRRQLRLSRAKVANISLASLIACTAWYAYTEPSHEARVTVLSAGDGDCILIQTPRTIWAIDAGSGQGSSVVDSAVRPALRLAGVRRLNGQIVASLQPPHASEAGKLMASCRPTEVWIAADAWNARGETLAGAQVSAASQEFGIPVREIAGGETLILDSNCRVEALWPPVGSDREQSLVLKLVCDNHTLLIVDPKAEAALTNLPATALHCDALIFTGPRRGTPDAFLMRRARELGATQVIWCGHGPWASRTNGEGEWNTSDGAVDINLSNRTDVHRAGS